MSSWLWTALKMLLFVETFCTLEEWVGPWEVGWGRCHLYRSWTQSQNVAPRETMKISRRTKSTKIKISLEPVCVSSCRHQSCPSGMLQVVLPPLPLWQTQEEAWVGALCFVLLFCWNTGGWFIHTIMAIVVGMANYDMLGDLVVVVHLANHVPRSDDMIPPPTWDLPAEQRLAKDLPLVEPTPQKPSRADPSHSDRPDVQVISSTKSAHLRAKWYSMRTTFPFTVAMATSAESSLWRRNSIGCL